MRGDIFDRSGRAALLIAGLALGVAACAHIVVRDVRASGEQWSLLLDAMTDGPDSFSAGSKYFVPASGERLFRVRISLRNDAPTAREFNFDRCDLDDQGAAIVPGAVAAAPISYETDRASTLKPGETIERWLIFSYSRERSPTRLSCVPMVIRLPPIPPR